MNRQEEQKLMDSQPHEPTYSQIINAADYNRMMTTEHLYIASADRAIEKTVRRYSEGQAKPAEVVEIGCGGARLTRLLADIPNTKVTGIDHDLGWVNEGQAILETQELKAKLVCANIEDYEHPKPIDIAVSQGSHHHIQKGEHTQRYLENIRRQLTPDGTYTISDEMIAYYATAEERYVRLCIWYSHIINNALRRRYQQLATVEMETLLDDLFEGSRKRAVKDELQMNLVNHSVPIISRLAVRGELKAAERAADKLLRGVWDTQSRSTTQEAPLSRGDYKVCFQVFEREVRDAGFRLREAKTIGPIETIGGFGIYTLEKAA